MEFYDEHYDGGNPEIIFSNLDDETKNIVKVLFYLDSGCDFSEGEYDITLTEIIQGHISKADFDYFDEPILDYFSEKEIPEEICLEFTLVENGEWETSVYAWNKWYEITGEPINRFAEPGEGEVA